MSLETIDMDFGGMPWRQRGQWLWDIVRGHRIRITVNWRQPADWGGQAPVVPEQSEAPK